MNYRKQFYDQYATIQVRPRGGSFLEEDYQNWADIVMQRINGWLPDEHDIPILDLGCGSGKLLYLFQRMGYTNLTGVDLSPEQIEHARLHSDQAVIFQEDAQDFLKKNSEQFGLICAFDLIEHFQKEEIIPLLRLIYQSLKPGGRLILQTPNAESPWMGSVAYGDFTHEWFFTPHSLNGILQMVGFENFQARECGPVIHGAKSLVRYWLWRAISQGLAIWNLAETGGVGGGVYSRVFLATVVKT